MTSSNGLKRVSAVHRNPLRKERGLATRAWRSAKWMGTTIRMLWRWRVSNRPRNKPNKYKENLSVAVVVKDYAVRRSQSILLILNFLKRQELDVTLVVESGGQLPEEILGSSRVCEIGPSRPAKAVALLFLRVAGHFDVAIAFDPHAFRLAARFVEMRKILYYSLELYVDDGLFNLKYNQELSEFERRNINKVAGLIIQSEERKHLFVAAYGGRPCIPTFLLPVCARGAESRWEPRVLPPPGSRKILHYGGISPYYGVHRFCDAMSACKGWTLLLHGHDPDGLVVEIQRKISSQNYQNVILTERYFEAADDAEHICEIADVGLAWYEGGLSPNYDTAAFSSGKIAAYLKHGLPIIVRKYGSFVDILEQSGSAIAIESPDELPLALEIIERNYRLMSQCALKTFATVFDFRNYELGLAKFILDAARRARKN